MCCYLSSSFLLLSFSACCYHISIRFLSYRPLHSGCVFPCFCFLHIPPSFLSSFFLSVCIFSAHPFPLYFLQLDPFPFLFQVSCFWFTTSLPASQSPTAILCVPLLCPSAPCPNFPFLVAQFVVFRHLRLYLVFPDFDQS